jgi:MoaA/NifB/PqqE/SkfB family radical SAM enzyme
VADNLHAASRLAPQPKLALHPQFAAHMAGRRVYPVNIEISPSGVCQASCDFCFYANTGELGEHRKVFLHPGRLDIVLRDAAMLGVKSITWTGGGEPSLHPQIASAVAKASLYGLQQGMFTNALSMPRYDPYRLAWVRVTMTDKPYKPECIRPLRNAKTLGFAFNYAGPQDRAYLIETLGLAASLNADYVQVRPALAFHGQTIDIEPPDIDHPLLHVTGYKFEDAKHKHGYATCEAYHFSPFIWEDGNLDVCAYNRKHEGYTLGNVYNDSLKDILDRAPQSVPVHAGCQVCCKLHEMNKLIHESRRLEDVNFP